MARRVRRPHWRGQDWPVTVLTPQLGRGRGMRRVLQMTVPVEFQLEFDESWGLWMVKMKRARGIHQYLPYETASRAVRKQLREALEVRMGLREPPKQKVVALRRAR